MFAMKKNGKLVAPIVMTKTPILAEGYRQVEYIQSSGNTQWIDTGIKDTEAYGIEVTLTPISKPADYASFLGAYYDNFNMSYLNYNTGMFGRIRTTGWGATINSTDKFTFKYEDSTVSSLQNGVKIQSSTISAGTLGNRNVPIYIFRCHSGNNTNGTNIKFYSLKLFNQSKELLRYFIPCYRESDEVIGLYDLVENKFYENQGSGVFTKGADVTPQYDDLRYDLKSSYVANKNYLSTLKGENV